MLACRILNVKPVHGAIIHEAPFFYGLAKLPFNVVFLFDALGKVLGHDVGNLAFDF